MMLLATLGAQFLPDVRKLLAIVVSILAILAAIILWGWHKESLGYARGTAEVTAKVQLAQAAEAARIRKANEEALLAGSTIVERIGKRDAELQATIKENANEAAQDAEHLRECLSADSVRRLNRIR